MDANHFDRLTRVLSLPGSRRAALAALLATAIGRAAPDVAAASQHRGEARSRRGSRGHVQAQAACANPGPGKNLDGCDFSGRDLSGRSLRGSSLHGALFVNATLRGTNLSDSNAKGAIFHGANLCGARLSASMLKQADFTDANLTRADLHASGCGGADFTGATFCRTRGCDGRLINAECQGCCADSECTNGQRCVAGACVSAGCVPAECERQNNACRTCSCSDEGSCLCAVRACRNGPCDPISGCPTCVPAECESQNNACLSCSCSEGSCLCGISACINGCDPVTGCL